MSDRIGAAEAILATVATAKGRIAALAHAHLPFDRVLALELKASAGASPERAALELTLDLLDRRSTLWRAARGAVEPVVIAEAPGHTLPVSFGPSEDLDGEEVGDEATPMSSPSSLAVPDLRLVVEPEQEITASHVEATLPSVHEEPSAEEDPSADDDDSVELVELEARDQISSTDPDEAFADGDDDIEAVLLDEGHAVDTGPILDTGPLLTAGPSADVDSGTEDAPDAETEEPPPPTSFDHLVRFVEPGARREPELLFEEDVDEEPVAEEATIQDLPPPIHSELDGDDLEAELLDEAVEAALIDEPSVANGEEYEDEDDDFVDGVVEEDDEADEPAVMEHPTGIYEDGGTEEGDAEHVHVEDDSDDDDELGEDGGTEGLDFEDDEPPVAPPPLRQPHAMTPSLPQPATVSEMDDERTLHGVPVLIDGDLDEEPAPPPRRDPPRATAAPVQVQPVFRPKGDQGSPLEIDTSDAEERAYDDNSTDQSSGVASSFSVTLERPVQEDDEEESVYDLGSSEPSNAPRLTDESEGYTVSTGEEERPRAEVDPAMAAEFLRKAREAESRGDLSKAIVHYQDLLDLTPESMDAYLGRGRSFMEMGDYAAAMSDFQRAEDLDQKSPEPLVEMGNLFFARKEYRRAIEFYDQAIEIDPTHAMARCRRGICHHYRKNHKQAFQDLQRAYSLNPEIPNIRKYVQMAVKAMEKSR